MNKIKNIFFNKEAFMYLIFGVLTTAVDYIVALLCFHGAGFGEITSNNIAWLVSVAFAYITNKLFVFESKSFQGRVLFKEIVSFLSARIITLIMADIIIWGASELNTDFLTAKIVSSVVVIVANYIFSKLIIFRKK
ncbi:MAG: GtrA family protein [Lachnospiraceae bacterium]|nr:GtrA family protein [Lachnospiraceae bacterium]MCI8824865.1 GtrA family protein [Lachnospiraceae bacterium]